MSARVISPVRGRLEEGDDIDGGEMKITHVLKRLKKMVETMENGKIPPRPSNEKCQMSRCDPAEPSQLGTMDGL